MKDALESKFQNVAVFFLSRHKSFNQPDPQKSACQVMRAGAGVDNIAVAVRAAGMFPVGLYA